MVHCVGRSCWGEQRFQEWRFRHLPFDQSAIKNFTQLKYDVKRLIEQTSNENTMLLFLWVP